MRSITWATNAAASADAGSNNVATAPQIPQGAPDQGGASPQPQAQPQAGGAQLLKILATITRLAQVASQLAPGLSPQMQQISQAVQDSMQTAMNQGQGATSQAPPY